LTTRQYQDIKSLFLSKVRHLVIYVPPEDFLQECFAGLCANGGNIKRALSYARRHTEPVRHRGQYMYEIPVGDIRGDIEHPRQFTKELGDV